MYDPVSRKWHHPIVPNIPLKRIILHVASAGGLLCFLDIGHRRFYVCNPLSSSFKELPARSAIVRPVSFDMESEVWKQYLVPAPLHLSYHALAEIGGRIMLVGLLTKNAATCVCTWELQTMTLLWKEVDRMPNVLCLEFYGKRMTMSCLGDRGLLMLSLESNIEKGMVEGPWSCATTRAKATVDFLWDCISSISNCNGLISFAESFLVTTHFVDVKFAVFPLFPGHF